MCDTLVALPSAAQHGALLFAKNSDRERNEAQFLEMRPAAQHAPGETVALTYIAIPQARRTHACLLSRPFWMWGAEMGANEHGVAIGNEAVHAVIPAQRRRALIGMDLVRLGLERAASAAEAVQVITGLLEAHGQGGDCGHLGRFYYNNSFIIADPKEAFVLETVGRWWVVKAAPPVRALSNALSLGEDYDRASPDLIDHARAQGWTEAGGRFDFAGRLIDRARDQVSFGTGRYARGGALLEAGRGGLTARAMMAILRDHGAEAGAGWSPVDTVGRTICMHAAEGARRSQSVGSWVSELAPGRAVHWVTGGAAPCLSVFKPVLFETGLPDQGPRPTDAFDPASRWWRHERLHRAVLRDFPARAAAFAPVREALERAFVGRVEDALARGEDTPALRALVDDCWREADAAEDAFLGALDAHAPADASPWRRSWTRLNTVAGMP